MKCVCLILFQIDSMIQLKKKSTQYKQQSKTKREKKNEQNWF